jgi:hypothetical protein
MDDITIRPVSWLGIIIGSGDFLLGKNLVIPLNEGGLELLA